MAFDAEVGFGAELFDQRAERAAFKGHDRSASGADQVMNMAGPTGDIARIAHARM